jgi:hypothetical protein
VKHFYKVLQNLTPQAVMVQLMRHEHKFPVDQQEGFGLEIRRGGVDTEDAAAFPVVKQVALTIAQLVDGVGVDTVVIWRLSSRGKAALPPRKFNGAQILLGLLSLEGVSILAGDESVTLCTGDAWMVESGDGAMLINNSTDDLFVMLVEVSF